MNHWLVQEFSENISLPTQLYCSGSFIPRLAAIVREKKSYKYQGFIRDFCFREKIPGLEAIFDREQVRLMEGMVDHGVQNWDHGLYWVCCWGYRGLMNHMIQSGARSWNAGLEGACTGGHPDLAEYMIARGAKQLHWGQWAACVSRHTKLVERMIIGWEGKECLWCGELHKKSYI